MELDKIMGIGFSNLFYNIPKYFYTVEQVHFFSV